MNNNLFDFLPLLSSTSLGIMLSEEDALSQSIMISIREKALKMHKTPITQGKGIDKRWVTQLPDKTTASGRKTIRKQTREEVEEVVIAFYIEIMRNESTTTLPKNICLRDMFLKWIEYRQNQQQASSTTIRKYRNDFKRLLDNSDFGQMCIINIDFIDIEEFLIEITQKYNLKKKALENFAGNLKGTFELAWRKRLLSENPFTRVDMRNIRHYCNETSPDNDERILSDAEIKILLSRLHQRHQEYPLYFADYAIEVCIHTGLRVGEVVALRWIDIQESELLIHSSEHRIYLENGSSVYEIGKTKNGKIRRVPISEELRTLLEKIRQLQKNNNIDSEFIFHNGKKRIPAHEVTHAMARRGNECGIKAKSIHAIRRTVSSKLNTMLPRATVAHIMGHTEEVNAGHYDYDVLELAVKTEAMNQLIAI